MTTNDIIQLLTQITTDTQAMLDVLTDGQALLELGITDNDIESIECAHDRLVNLEHYNDTFERMIIEACKQHLKPTIEPYTYATVTLDELFNGTLYASPDNTKYFFEIPARDTLSGLPVVIHLK